MFKKGFLLDQADTNNIIWTAPFLSFQLTIFDSFQKNQIDLIIFHSSAIYEKMFWLRPSEMEIYFFQIGLGHISSLMLCENVQLKIFNHVSCTSSMHQNLFINYYDLL